MELPKLPQVGKEGFGTNLPILDGSQKLTAQELTELRIRMEAAATAEAFAQSTSIHLQATLKTIKDRLGAAEDEDLQIDFATGKVKVKKAEKPKEDKGGKTETPSPKKSA